MLFSVGSSDVRSSVRALALSMLFGMALLGASRSYGAPPKLNFLYPAGVRQGQAASVTASGEFGQWPARPWVDRPGLTVTCENDKGKLKIEAAPDAVGVYWIRLHDDEGASAPRPVVVGSLPEVEEVEPNDALAKAQVVESSVTINGKLAKGGDVDSFAIALRAGQVLVASVDAHTRLGSPMDGSLQISRIDGTYPLAGATLDPLARPTQTFVLEQRDDEVGQDPRITFTAPRDGWYLVRLFAFPTETNSTIAYAGADNYVYRLTLTTGPFVEYSLPLAVSKTQPSELRLLGANLTDANGKVAVAPLAADAAANATRDDEPYWIKAANATCAMALPWLDTPLLMAADDCSLAKPQVVTLPVTITGRLLNPREDDAFQVTMTKGQRVQIRVESRALGFGLDPYIQVLDATNKVVAEGDDSNNQRDVELLFTAPADGDFRIVVRDVHRHGGSRFVYRLSLQEPKPDFALSVAADSFVLTAGKPLEIPVTVNRLHGFAQPIEVRVEGLPAGVTCEAVSSQEKGDSAKSVKLTLNADPAAIANPVGQPIRVVGVSTQPVEHRHSATFAIAAPAATLTSPWLTVRK